MTDELFGDNAQKPEVPDMAEWGLRPGDIQLAVAKGKTRIARVRMLMLQFNVDEVIADTWLRQASS